MRQESQYSGILHGISILASGSEAVISALTSRLGALPSRAKYEAALNFHFRAAPTGNSHVVDRPAGVSRPFYMPAVGEALYFAEDDLIYLDYDGRARCLCHPGEGRCCVSLLEPESEQLWLASHPLFTLPFLEMMKRRGMFNVHAACFACRGNGLILAGTSGAGKSTLSIALLQAGLDFLGDDMVFLHQANELELLAFPESVDIADPTIAFFAGLHSLHGMAKRPGWPKHEIRAESFFPSRIAWRAKPAAIVFPRISHKPNSSLSRISSDEAFLELAPNVLLTEAKSTQAHFERLADLVKGVPAYRLHTGTNFVEVSEMLRDLIQ